LPIDEDSQWQDSQWPIVSRRLTIGFGPIYATFGFTALPSAAILPML
jgi:hypothetical protein